MPFYRFFFYLSCGLATTIPNFAAEDDPIKLATMAVVSDRPAPLTVIAVEAARRELARSPGGTETIDADRYLRGRASTVDDTFALSPGVVALSRFGSDEARLSIRGSGLQRTFHGRGIRVLQDGVPINLADGGFDMQALEPLSAAYIKVWRGGNALASGASTLGGAIDYISRTGRETPGRLARLETGSWDYLRVNISEGSSRGDLDAYTSLTHQSQRGYRDHARQSNQRIFANTGWRFSADGESRVYVTAVRTASELPGNLTKAELATDPTQANAGNLALHQKRDFDLLRIASKTTVAHHSTVWDFTAAWTYKDLDHPIFQVFDQLSNDLLLGAVGTRSNNFAGHSHHLTIGFLFQRGFTQSANFSNLGGRRGALLATADQTATNVELFAEDQVQIGRHLTFVLGANAARNRRMSDQTLGGTPDYDLVYHRFMPKVGLRWDGQEVQVFTNVSGSYEPPSFSETLTLNTARKSQTASTWELGTRGTRGPLRWDATVYHATLRHELLSLDHDQNPATPSATINADATTHSGLEVSAEIDLLGHRWIAETEPSHRLVLRAAWTYGRFRFDHDSLYGNNPLAGLPPHLLRGELTWENQAGWYAGPTWQGMPQPTFVDFRNTLAADSYAIFGFRVGRQVARGFSWFIEARNLANQSYAATTGILEDARATDQRQFLPGDGRGFYLGLSFAQ